MSRFCDWCGRGIFEHRWLTTHEYEQLPEYVGHCVRNGGIFWVAPPEDWEPEFILNTLDKRGPDDPCDSDFMKEISS